VGTPGTIVGFERWASAADHDRHLQADHVARLMTKMGDLLAEPPLIVSYEILED